MRSGRSVSTVCYNGSSLGLFLGPDGPKAEAEAPLCLPSMGTLSVETSPWKHISHLREGLPPDQRHSVDGRCENWKHPSTGAGGLRRGPVLVPWSRAAAGDWLRKLCEWNGSHTAQNGNMWLSVLRRSLLFEGGGGRSGALSRLKGGVERTRRGRGGRSKAQRGQMGGCVPGAGGRRWDEENRWWISLGQERVTPSCSVL